MSEIVNASAQKPALAFMQNMWLKNPGSFHKNYARQKEISLEQAEDYRSRVIEYALFAGCLSGRRLKSAFHELCDAIQWEESTREISSNAREIFPADLEHIRNAIEIYQPKIILTFGGIAYKAVQPLWRGELIRCPHPAARQPDTQLVLQAGADRLEEFLRNL